MMTNLEKITLNIEDFAITRIKSHTATNDGGYTYFCGDFNNSSDINKYNNLFQSTEQAYRNALKAEIEWLNSEAKES